MRDKLKGSHPFFPLLFLLPPHSMGVTRDFYLWVFALPDSPFTVSAVQPPLSWALTAMAMQLA